MLYFLGGKCMKKAFYVGLGILIALSLTFIACGDSTEPEAGEGGSFRVDTRIAKGGVLLTWEPVANALSYKIYRQQVSPYLGQALLLGEDITRDQPKLFYADVKGLTNNLQPDVEYHYWIIAITSTENVGQSDIFGPNEAVVRTVRFSQEELPDPDSITLTPVENLQLRASRNAGNNVVVATWDADENPLVHYDVAFNGNYSDTTIDNISSMNITGNVYVAVRKILGDGLYYKPSDGTGAYIAGPAESLTATRDDKGVTLLFTTQAKLEQNVLSRKKLAPTVEEEWTKLVVTSARLVTITTSVPYSYTYELYDTLPTSAEKNSVWLYQLEVNSPGSGVHYAAADALPAGKLKAPVLSYIPNTTYPTTGVPQHTDALDAHIYLTYTTEPGASYTVLTKPTTLSNGVDLPENSNIGWVSAPATIVATSATSQTVKITLPEARTEYAFKVRATRSEYESAESAETTVQFRDPIIPASASSTPALYYDLTMTTDYVFAVSNEANSTEDEKIHYRLVVPGGLAGNPSLNETFLRAGETLEIEVIAKGGAPAQPSKQTLVWTGDAPLSSTEGFYFTKPVLSSDAITAGESYEFRLHVTAK